MNYLYLNKFDIFVYLKGLSALLYPTFDEVEGAEYLTMKEF